MIGRIGDRLGWAGMCIFPQKSMYLYMENERRGVLAFRMGPLLLFAGPSTGVRRAVGWAAKMERARVVRVWFAHSTEPRPGPRSDRVSALENGEGRARRASKEETGREQGRAFPVWARGYCSFRKGRAPCG